jgi:hypothetical protein
LSIGLERRQVRCHISREGRWELRLVQEQKPLDWRQDRGLRAFCGEAFDHSVRGLAGIRRESADVDKGRDIRVIACLRDDSATVRVADQDRGFGLLIENPPDNRRIVCQRSCRVLGDADLITGLAEAAIHRLPSRTVYETTVYENYWSH